MKIPRLGKYKTSVVY